MSEEYGIEVQRYEGPEYISGDFKCPLCNNPYKVRIIDNVARLCYVTSHRYSKDGVETERLCSDCHYDLWGLIDQIDNYNHTGDPDDTSWLDDDGEIYE